MERESVRVEIFGVGIGHDEMDLGFEDQVAADSVAGVNQTHPYAPSGDRNHPTDSIAGRGEQQFQ